MKLQERYDHVFHTVKDDIFEITSQLVNSKSNLCIVIPHVCNNVNAFGAGFADAVSKKYPAAKANFHVNGAQKLSKTQFITVYSASNNSRIVVANMIAQNGLFSTKNKRPLHYPSLIKCMYDVKDFLKTIRSNTEANVEIHAPRFGSGLAGGNWFFISDLIDDIWPDIDTFIYIQK